MTPDYKKQFPRSREVVYLDTAAEGLPAPGAAASFEEYCRDKSMGTPGRRRFHAVEEECRGLAARLLGTEPQNVAFMGSASEALGALAGGLGLVSGDRVLISDLEFPSNILPWLRLRDAGVEVVVVPSTGGTLRLEDILGNLSARTRLVSLSLVSYKTGAYLPFIRELAEEVHRAGAVLSIDATQALGRLPVAVDGIDYLMSSSFKWLLGPHGLGIVYLSPELRERLNPQGVGWYSVRNCFTPDRFERYELKPGAACLSSGMPNFPSLYALRSSLKFVLEARPSEIDARLKSVVEDLRSRLAEMGVPLLTPSHPASRSGIVAFSHPEAERIGSALERAGVIVWAGDGRVRSSVHLYNDGEDVSRYIDALRSVLAGEAVARG